MKPDKAKSVNESILLRVEEVVDESLYMMRGVQQRMELIRHEIKWSESMMGGASAVAQMEADKRRVNMGRYKKYRSDKALREAVEGYFAGISRTVDVMEERKTGELDKFGHFVKEWVPVCNDRGEVIRAREFVIPPAWRSAGRHGPSTATRN